MRQTTQPVIRIDQVDEIGSEEIGEASETAGESLVKMFGEAADETATTVKGKRETEEVQRRIETRLRYLTRMYVSNKDKQAEEEDDS